MRFNRLTIFILLASACKSVAPTSSGSYEEDLSIHRPSPAPDTVGIVAVGSIEESYTPLRGHIGAELDSIAKISYLQNKTGRYVDGYVIQVYSGTTRNTANEAQFRMNQLFPELKPRVTYRQPNFKVKGGKFIDRLEANRVYNEVKKEFSRALLIPERLLISYD